jgi:hypothetical protein
MTNNRHLSIVVGALATALLVIGVLATVAFLGLRHQQHQRDVDMRESRITSCVRFNLNQRAAREGQVAGFVAVIQGFGAGVRPAVTETVRHAAEVAAAKSFPYRKCTQAEIDNYLRSPPPDPAENCPGDSRGYCKETP